MGKKHKLNLTEELTTHKSDFQIWPIHPVEVKAEHKSREPIAVKPPPPYVPIDHQSHAPYTSSVHIPFDLYLKPKPIVGTDPRECFPTIRPLKDRMKGGRSYTTTILSPALALDQVEDEECLNQILNYTYIGMHKILFQEAALKSSKNPNPPLRLTVEGHDLRYKPNLYPPLPPGWITAARHWDALQSRHLGNPLKTFWARRTPEAECSCCCNPSPYTLPKETKEEIDRLINENKISLAYDNTKTGYGGYRPMVAKGVPLEKK